MSNDLVIVISVLEFHWTDDVSPMRLIWTQFECTIILGEGGGNS